MTPDYRALCAELIEAVLSDDSHIDCIQIARRARALLAEPEPEGPTDQEIEEWADTCPEAPLEEMDPEVHGWRRCFTAKEFSETIRAALARWGRPTPQPPADGEVPRIDHILRLAEIIREVDGCHDKGAAALAEAILSHPGICSAGLAALAQPVAEGPTDEEIISQADKFLAYSDAHMGDPARWEGSGVDLVAFTRHALARWGRPAAAPVPVSELPQGWHMLSDIEPEPGAMCDWVIMAPWGCDHGSGKWRDYDGVSSCEFFDVPVGWPVRYKGFASADGVMVSDPKLTAWRMLSLPTMAAEVRL